MPQMIRCAIYIRVSSAEQVMHGHSLDAQVRFLTDFAHNKNWKVVGVYAGEGKTARKELKRRKAIKELLNHVEADEIDMILFWKMGRWFRNVADFYKVQDILDAHNCRWTAAAEPSMNLKTREGRLNVNIMLSINQNETDTTSERIKFVNESSVKLGKAIVGTPSMPLGYKVLPVDGVKRIVKDPETEALVEEMFEYYFKHQSKFGTLNYTNTKYGLNIGNLAMNNLTTNTLFYGSYRGNDNYCPAYITKEQFDAIQVINEHNVKVYHSLDRVHNPFIFTGLVCCPEHYNKKSCAYGKVLNEQTAEAYLLENIERLFEESQDLMWEVDNHKRTIKKCPANCLNMRKS